MELKGSRQLEVKENRVPLKFLNVIFERKPCAVPTYVLHKEEDAVGKAAADRIYQSISFLP